MRVIVLRPWAYNRAFVVVVILIPNVPIEPVVQLDRQPRFRRLETHRIRCDQRAWIAGWIGTTISLAGIFVDSITGKQCRSWRDVGHRLNKEEVVSDEVKTVAERMLNAIEEIVENRFAVYPVIVVAGADREPRSCGPIE